MSDLWNCPNCGQEITIPEGIDESTPLCCPICDAEFMPGQATRADTAAPPEVSPIETISEETPVDAAEIEVGPPDAGAAGPEAEPEAEKPDTEAALFASWASDAENEAPEEVSLEQAPEEDELLDLADEPLDLADEPLDLADEPLDLADEPLELADGVLELADGAPEMADKAPEPEGEGTEFAAWPLADEAETPEVPEAPEAGAEVETYDLQPEVPEVESESPVPGAGPSDAEAEAVKAAVQTYKARAEELKAKADALVAEFAALEAEMSGAAGDRPQLDVWRQVGAVPRIDTGEEEAGAPETGAGGQVAAAGAFDFAAADAGEGGETVGTTAARPRSRRKKKSAFLTLMEWVFGGVAGLLIAYYAINWIRGEQGNFLKIPLPGVPHTYQHCPEWWPQWLKPWADSEQPGAEGAASSDTAGNPGQAEPPQQASARTPSRPSPAASPAQPKPRPKEFPPDYVGLVAPPSYSPAELGTALKAAHASYGCPECNSTGRVIKDGKEMVCPECQGHPPEGINPMAYRDFCRLAEVVTFVDNEADGGQIGPRKSAIGDLLAKVGRSTANVDKIGFQAGRLCLSRDREGNGILLAGTVTRVGTAGHANAAHVKMATIGRTVIVVTKAPLPIEVGDNVFILGRIVDQPAENLVGFDTPQPLVVWGGMAVKIEG